MKYSFLVVLGAVANPLGQVPAAKNPVGELEMLKARYESAIEPIRTEREARLEAVKAPYLASLDALQKQLTAKNDLASAVQVKAERERVLSGKEPDPAEKRAMGSALAPMRARFERDIASVAQGLKAREQALTKEHSSALDRLLKKVTGAGDLDSALLVQSEKDRLADVIGSTASMSLAAARAMFDFGNREPGKGTDYFTVQFGGEGIPILSKKSFKATNMDFGFKVRSTQYQGIEMVIDGKMAKYSRGHWRNEATQVVYGGEQHLPGKVDSPDRWNSLEAQLRAGTISFSYNGKVEWSQKLPPPASPSGYDVRLGFDSHETRSAFKDFHLNYR